MMPSCKTTLRGENGVALVITLSMLVLITIIVVGMVGALRVERGAAASHAERARAFELAKMGENDAVARLQQNTADPTRTWISQPGQLIAGAATGDKTTLIDPPIALHSGSGVATGGTDPDPNLNVATFLDPQSNLITDRRESGAPGAEPMHLQWIYVLQDGTPATARPAPNPNNPVVGRYAYWTDDESSKVNYNTAWSRMGNTEQPGHPSRINLAALDGFDQNLADELHSEPALFNSPQDARRLENAAEALMANKFEVTHYNHDPDTTFFNKPRIALTTQAKYAPKDPRDPTGKKLLIDEEDGRPYFLDILNNPGTADSLGDDPGTVGSVNFSKLTSVLNKLISYLERDDWPIATGSSFQEKYYRGKTDRLTQLALNIVDYVRSKESSDPVIEPIRGNMNSGVFVSGLGNYMGMGRTPMITELGLSKQPGGYVFKIELCAPKNGGVSNYPLNKIVLYTDLNRLPDKINTHSFIGSHPGDTFSKPTIGVPGTDDYVTVTRKINSTVTLPNPCPVRIAIAKEVGQGGRHDIVPLTGEGDRLIDLKIAEKDEEIVSMEVDDPRVNKHPDDWKENKDGRNSFGEVNSISTIGEPAPSVDGPQMDTDADGRISDASLYMPPPRTNADPASGVVASVGELGYVHTGMESLRGAGVPWRTLRLQPSKEDENVLPDWALMDLFTVPAMATQQSKQAVFAPHNSTIGGRININSKVEPFGMERIIPLKAALLGAQKNNAGDELDESEAGTIAGNIYKRTLSTTDGQNRGDYFGFEEAYDSPGEICEIAGVADDGEESEALVRELANLVTTRGDVFTIYSIGQALKETANGDLIVTAEQRQQTMVERYPMLDSSGNTLIGFNTVYFRNLTP